MSSSSEKLSSLFNQRMREMSVHVYGSGSLGLGTISSGMGLKMDNLTYTIPQADYMVCRSLKLNSECFSTKKANDHVHELNYPMLKVGDRVLVGVVGTEYIVIDVVI